VNFQLTKRSTLFTSGSVYCCVKRSGIKKPPRVAPFDQARLCHIQQLFPTAFSLVRQQ